MALADAGLHVDSLIPRPGQRVDAILPEMDRDGVAFACILPDPRSARHTVDVQIFRGPRPQCELKGGGCLH